MNRNARLAVLLALGVLAAGPAFTQEPPSPVPSAAVIHTDTAPAINDSDPAAATRAWLETVPADKRAKSDAYFEGGYWLILWNYLVTAAIALALLQTRLSARMRDWAEGITRKRALQVGLFAIPYLLLTTLLAFPLYFYQGFVREHAYQLATQNFGAWIKEQLTALLVQLIVLPLVLMALYAVFRRAPRTWWLWGTGLAVVIVIVSSTLSPIFIEPLFNTYKPLNDPAISQPILAMARANQIPVTQVYEVDASRQSNRVSANVAGFGSTTRIALNDNLLKQCTVPEIREVMAHEMGHYVLNHGFKLILYSSVFIFLAFVILRATFETALRRWGARWGVREIADPAGLPLLTLIFSTVFFFLTPVNNSMTRITEREADAFAINTSREPDGMARVALKLGSYRKLDPTPLEELIFFDHPSGRARIRMAMDWKAARLPAGGSTASEASAHH